MMTGLGFTTEVKFKIDVGVNMDFDVNVDITSYTISGIDYELGVGFESSVILN